MRYYPRLLLSSEFEIVEIGDEVTAVSVGDNSPYSGVKDELFPVPCIFLIFT